MIKTIEAVVNHFDWQGPVGCGFPAVVKNEIVKTASNIDNSWIGVNASEQIEKKTGCPTHLVNDVDAAGFAEITFGAGKNRYGTIVMAAFGTGIGTAIFHNQHLVPNTELGHIPMHNMPAEDYAANSIRKKHDFTWEKWGGRVNEYLQLIEALFWPDNIIIGGGVNKKFSNLNHIFIWIPTCFQLKTVIMQVLLELHLKLLQSSTLKRVIHIFAEVT